MATVQWLSLLLYTLSVSSCYSTCWPAILRYFVLSVVIHAKICQYIFPNIATVTPVPVAAQSKASVFGRSPAEIVGSNPAGGMDVCLL